MGLLGGIVKGALGAVGGGLLGGGGGVGGAIGGAIKGAVDHFKSKSRPVISEEGAMGKAAGSLSGRMKRKGITRALRSSR